MHCTLLTRIYVALVAEDNIFII